MALLRVLSILSVVCAAQLYAKPLADTTQMDLDFLVEGLEGVPVGRDAEDFVEQLPAGPLARQGKQDQLHTNRLEQS